MSIVSDILDVIKTRLLLVTTGNGYENTVTGVEIPPKFATFKIEDRRVIIRSGDIEQDPELGSPGNPPRVAWVLPVLVSGLVMPSDRETDSIDKDVHDFGAELQTAIATVEGADDWSQFDGNAVISTMGAVRHSLTEDATNAAEFILRITYRVSETDQNELRG